MTPETAQADPSAAAPLAAVGDRKQGSSLEVLRVFLRLGLTSFGGPVAHLGYFRAEFVERRRWLDEPAFADIVALCQFLPGPASSQVGISLGILRAGLPGAFAAWLGFTSPSALAMILFAYGVTEFGDLSHAAWLHGLKIVAVAVVAQAVWGMARSLCPDRERATIAVGSAILALAVPSAAGQIGAIVAGGLIGWALLRDGTAPQAGVGLAVHLPRVWSVAAAIAFFGLLIGLPVLAAAVPSHTIALIDSFYRSGCARVRRRPRRLAAAPGRSGAARMGDQRYVSGRLRCGSGGTWPALHLLGLSRHGHGTGTQRLDGWSDLPRRDLPAVVSAADRGVAVLGYAAAAAGGAIGVARRQCRGGWPVAGRTLQARMDERDPRTGRFRDRDRGFPATGIVGGAPMGRGYPWRGGGNSRCGHSLNCRDEL